MEINNKIIWHEGMLLQPQHFQQQDRYFSQLIHYHHSLDRYDHWGFSRLTLNEHLLSLGKIGIAEAEGCFQDGTYFNMPNNDELPTPYTIREGLNGVMLYLCIPIRQAGIAEICNDSSSRRYRYHMIQREVNDTTAEGIETTQLTVGSVAAVILSDEDDLSDYLCMPIAKIEESRSNHHITFDRKFIPSWMNAHQSKALNEFIKEVYSLLNHRAEMLAGRLTDTQQAGTAEIVDFMLLQLSNKYESLFKYIHDRQQIHPENLYEILLEMLGEMATFTNNKRRPIEAPAYQHDKLFETFKPIIHEVRHALSMVLEQNATAIPLELRGHGLWVGTIHEKELLKTCSFILSVYADVPIETVRTHFSSQIKIAPVERIKTLVSKALPGVPIQTIAVAPRQIPYHANFSYFSLDTKHEQWQLLEKSGGIALHVGSAIPGLKLELWAIKG